VTVIFVIWIAAIMIYLAFAVNLRIAVCKSFIGIGDYDSNLLKCSCTVEEEKDIV